METRDVEAAKKSTKLKYPKPPVTQVLKERLHHLFNKKEAPVSKEDLPPIDIGFYFSGHTTGTHGKFQTKDIADYDIFLMEGVGWLHEDLETYRDVANGEISLKEPSEDFVPKKEHAFVRGMLRNISNTGVVVGYWDVPEGSKEAKRAIETRDGIIKTQVKILQALKTGNFDQAIQAERQQLQDTVHLHERDRYLISHFPQIIKELIDSHSELEDKQSIKVLIGMGAGHTQITREFKDAGYSVSKEYSEVPYYYSHSNAAVMRLLLGKDISELQCAHAILEDFIGLELDWSEFPEDSYDIQTEFITHVARQFSLGEIQSWVENTKGDKVQNLLTLLNEKGIGIPKTDDELNSATIKLRYANRDKNSLAPESSKS